MTFVNFTVTRSSLQSQCLNEVLKAERPDVDEKRSDLLKLQGTVPGPWLSVQVGAELPQDEVPRARVSASRRHQGKLCAFWSFKGSFSCACISWRSLCCKL